MTLVLTQVPYRSALGAQLRGPPPTFSSRSDLRGGPGAEPSMPLGTSSLLSLTPGPLGIVPGGTSGIGLPQGFCFAPSGSPGPPVLKTVPPVCSALTCGASSLWNKSFSCLYPGSLYSSPTSVPLLSGSAGRPHTQQTVIAVSFREVPPSVPVAPASVRA